MPVMIMVMLLVMGGRPYACYDNGDDDCYGGQAILIVRLMFRRLVRTISNSITILGQKGGPGVPGGPWPPDPWWFRLLL